MQKFGIIGYPLGHSFSAKYFSQKFTDQHIDACYNLFPLKQIEEFTPLIRQHTFTGLNVTLPYKEQIIPYLDKLDETAQAIGAVNVIHFTQGQSIGYNTDVIGFRNSLRTILLPHHTHALILGTGGAAKAVWYGLQTMDIHTLYVSRTRKQIQTSKGLAETLTYQELNAEILTQYTLIVNCTPLGMYPAIDTCAPLPYNLLTQKHLLYDVVYNPEKTLFLQHGEEQGCCTQNGRAMLEGQAEAAWKIWTD